MISRARRTGMREAVAKARDLPENHEPADRRLAPELADYVEDLLEALERDELSLPDAVLEILDTSADRVPVGEIAGQLGADPLETEAAVVALLHDNLCGEEPPGYFFTDDRDPEFKARAQARAAQRQVSISSEAYRVLCGLMNNEEVPRETITALGETWDELKSIFPLADYGPMKGES